MMHIAIVDGNPFIARQVKRFLGQAGHRVTLGKQDEPGASSPDSPQPDLVLIGQRTHEDCGWPCFNRWQETVPGLPLMLYALDDCNPGCLRLLAQAVAQAEEVLAGRRRSRSTLSMNPPMEDFDQCQIV